MVSNVLPLVLFSITSPNVCAYLPSAMLGTLYVDAVRLGPLEQHYPQIACAQSLLLPWGHWCCIKYSPHCARRHLQRKWNYRITMETQERSYAATKNGHGHTDRRSKRHKDRNSTSIIVSTQGGSGFPVKAVPVVYGQIGKTGWGGGSDREGNGRQQAWTPDIVPCRIWPEGANRMKDGRHCVTRAPIYIAVLERSEGTDLIAEGHSGS